jgi:hypothetical protein
MATRSTIVKKNEDGSYTGIYCHWDGYPSHNGKILLENYNSQEKVDSLIALGNISSLNRFVTPDPNRPTAEANSTYKKIDLSKPHSFDNSYGDTVVAYHRDRGEDFVQYSRKSLIDVLDKIDHEYAYVWGDGKWEVWGYDYQGESLEKVLEKKDS